MVHSSPLRQSDSFSLPLSNQRTFEFRKAAQHVEQQLAHRVVVACEYQILFQALNGDTADIALRH